MSAFTTALLNQGERLAQEAAAAQKMAAFVAYAREIGCTLGEGVMHDCIDVHTDEQAALLNAKWRELAPPRCAALSVQNRRLCVDVLDEDLGGLVMGAPATFCTLDLPDLDRLLDAARDEGRKEAGTCPTRR